MNEIILIDIKRGKILIILTIIYILSFFYIKILKIKNFFFIIDSNHLENVQSHMYGFIVSRKGIITDNYYKNLGYYEDPEPLGAYAMIRKIGDKIIINQDYIGSYGIYIYENQNKGNFYFSNSFFLLLEYLVGKEHFTLNKDFTDNLIISGLCTPSIDETMVNEIKMLPSNSFIIINIKKREYKINYIDYKEKSVPLKSVEGIKIIDKWVDKWGFIIRSLKKQINNISSDLSGGFDSRLTLSILLSSGVNIKEISINSIVGWKGHEKDFKISSKICKKLGLKIIEFPFHKTGIKINIEDAFLFSKYVKLGFTNWLKFPDVFFTKPNFHFTGYGGELLRGKPSLPIKKYIEELSNGYNSNFYNSSIRLCNRSVTFLKDHNIYYNDYEISADLYSKGRNRHHFGKLIIEQLLSNTYILCPLLDPDILQIDYEISDHSHLDLISYIYVRFSHNLLKFPFVGKRRLTDASLKKAEKLNKNNPPYRPKIDYNKNFYINKKRYITISSSSSSIKTNSTEQYKYIEKLFNYSELYFNIIKFYDNTVYYKAKNYSEKTKLIIYKNSLIAVGNAIKKYFDNKRYFNNID